MTETAAPTDRSRFANLSTDELCALVRRIEAGSHEHRRRLDRLRRQTLAEIHARAC